MSDVPPYVTIVLGHPAGVGEGPGPHDPGDGPQLAVVIDPAQAPEPAELLAVLHRLIRGLDDLGPASPGICVVASHPVTDTLKIVDDRQVLLGTADRDHYRWVSGPVAGPLATLAAAARGATSMGELLTALIEEGQQVRAVRA